MRLVDALKKLNPNIKVWKERKMRWKEYWDAWHNASERQGRGEKNVVYPKQDDYSDLTGKKRLLHIHMTWQANRTLIYNPTAEMLAYYTDSHCVVGMCRTVRKKLKGFYATKTNFGYTHMIEIKPKEVIQMIKSFRRKKPRSMISDDAISETVISAL